MNERKDGGPAFSLPAHKVRLGEGRQTLHVAANNGMSLRDYFAAHAPDPPYYWTHSVEHEDQFYIWRWHYADAMIAERDK
jgi:hypothetical protein